MLDGFESFFEQPADVSAEPQADAVSTEPDAGAPSAQEQTDVAAKGEGQSAEPASKDAGDEFGESGDSDNGRMVPLASLKSERGKRQSLEQDNQDLRNQLLEFQRLQAKVGVDEQGETPDGITEDDFFADPVGTIKRIREEARAEVEAKFLERDRAREDKKIIKRANELRAEHEDFNAHYKHFVDALKFNPQLEAAARQSGDPVKWGYEWGKLAKELEGYGDDMFGAMERIKQDAYEKAKADLLSGDSRGAVAGLPKTQAGAQSVGQRGALATEYDPLKVATAGNPF